MLGKNSSSILNANISNVFVKTSELNVGSYSCVYH